MEGTPLDLGNLLILFGLLLIASLACAIHDYRSAYERATTGDVIRWLLGRERKNHMREK